MKVSELRGILNILPFDADVSIQLPDNEPPVDFVVEHFDNQHPMTDAGKDYLSRNPYPDSIILLPLPPVDGAVWDHDNNIITWYSIDSDATRLEGEG